MVTAVTVAGLGCLATATALDWRTLALSPSGHVLLFTALVVVGELLPVRVRRGDGEEEITVSTPFAFTLLLTSGLAAASLALVLASLVADTARRKPLWKSLFNAAQFVLSMAAAAAVLHTAGLHMWRPHHDILAAELPVMVLAGAAFFLANNVLTGAAIALASGRPIIPFLRRDFLFQLGTTGVLLSLAPIVVAAADDTLLLVPLLVMPIAAVHKCASILMAKEHAALHDALTSLPNRTSFRGRVTEALGRAQRAGTATSTAVVLIDLDRFKEVNDTLGYGIGDLLLQQIGPRLAGVLRDTDTIARLGGDEFAVLLPDVTSEIVAMEIADRMLEALEQHFDLPEVVVDIDASIGIALAPAHGTDADVLMQRADVAMYLAKETRSGYQVYAADRDPYSPRHLSLLHDVRHALEADQFVLYYQPKAALGSGEIVGVEALLRWMHPELGVILPDRFIPLAERSGLSRPLTLFVLEQALRQLSEWRRAGIELRMAVNLTGRNLHDPSFPVDVARLLASSGLPADSLLLEITENSVMTDPNRVLGVLKALREMGVELALDDFGTGYSSLAYLKRLPVHELKIDKSFVMNMSGDESDAVIVRSTIGLARNLRLRVVAEGVEDKAAWDELVSLGCDVAQGYFLSRPVPPAQLTAWLGRQPAPAAKAKPPLRAVN
ncbi:MAG TPA: EAL domain-containing protein [Acidimicrobiales bacterium]|nr:EAL domain-containing protein [Acidimicrobiales bacterium]